MAKPDANAAQNLDEILASIRKSLSEETTDGLADLKSTETAAVATPAPGPAVPAAPPRNEGLTSRIAGALNGAGKGHEDDLADFFAHVPKKSAPESEGAAAKADGPAEGGKDPFWFLGRSAPDGVGSAEQPTPAKIELSRPETLRPSLPPLFGDGREVAVPGKVADDRSPALKAPEASPANQAKIQSDPIGAALSREPKSEPKGEAKVEATPPKLDLNAFPKAAGSATTAFVPGPLLPAQQKLKMRDLMRGASPKLGATPAPLPAEDTPTTGAQGADSVGAASETLAPAAQPDGGEGADGSMPAEAAPEAAKSPAATAGNTAVLETMIGQVLEPVLVRWLDANLPRLIEKLVREEVARATAKAESDAPKV